MRLAWLCVISLAACRAADRPAAPTCASGAAALKTLLVQMLDPAAKPKPPWPTGDATTDRRIDEERARLRAALVPPRPEQRLRPLKDGVTPGTLEHELASCQPALDQLVYVGNAPPAARNAAFAAIADRIAACDCQVNLPFVSALFYLFLRGPD